MRKVRRSVPLWLVIVLLLATVTLTATALTVWMLQVERINIWEGQIQDTDFTVIEIDTKIKGKHRIDITLALKNNDASNTHSADVTVQLLDSNGNVILEQTVNTGDVVAGGTWSYTFTFTQNNLVSQYDRPFIIVEQGS